MKSQKLYELKIIELEVLIMAIVDQFTNLTKSIAKLIPNLLAYDQKNRDEIIEVVSNLADELLRGLNIVTLSLEATRSIDEPNELQAYIRDLWGKTYNTFSEFRICMGLRKIEDRFNRTIAPIKASINVENLNAVSNLIEQLGNHERLVFDMIDEEIAKINAALQNINDQDGEKQLRAAIESAIQSIEAKKSAIKGYAREIIGKI